MLRQKEQIEYIKKHFKLMIKRIGELKQGRDPETIHQFRIEVNKIKALNSLRKACMCKDISSGIQGSLKKEFQLAGEVRKLQVTQTLIDEFKLGDSKPQYFQFDYSKKRVKFLLRKIKKKFKKLKELRKDLLVEIEDIPSGKIKIWILDLMNEIGGSYKEECFQNKLHYYRKRIKRLLYLRPLLYNSNSIPKGLNFNYLRQLQGLIGEWHDLTEFFLVKNLTIKPETLQFNILQSRINRLLKGVINKIADFEVKVFQNGD